MSNTVLEIINTNIKPKDFGCLTKDKIELRKENWVLVIYTIECQGFKESESWTDEYKRILKLFEETIGK